MGHSVASSPSQADVDAVAAAIMQLADRHCTNGQLTLTELQTFLRGTPYELFADWVSKSSRLLAHDSDRNGVIDAGELHHAVRVFLQESMKQASPPMMPQHEQQPKSRRIATKKRKPQVKSDSKRTLDISKLEAACEVYFFTLGHGR